MVYCPFCTYSTNEVSSLFFHIKINHCTLEKKVYQCKEENCMRLFQNVYAFRQHIIKKHAKNTDYVNIFQNSTATLLLAISLNQDDNTVDPQMFIQNKILELISIHWATERIILM